MSKTIIQHIKDLRQAMYNNDIDLYIQPSSDPHLSEYVADRFKGREYLTGFTGSAGTVLITQTEAVCYTDGRYFIQAEKELKGSNVDLMKLNTSGYPSMSDWIKAHSQELTSIGFDGRLYSTSDFIKLKNALEGYNLNYTIKIDLLNEVWTKRPKYPSTPLFVHELKYTGLTADAKIKAIQSVLKKNRTSTYLMSSLNDIAWLFNIRANDVAYTPVAYAYAIITLSGATLYVNSKQLDEKVIGHLSMNHIDFKDYDSFYKDIETLSNTAILLDPVKTNALTTTCLADSNHIHHQVDPTYTMKACLHPIEKDNLLKAQERDGVAMVQFLTWFDSAVAGGCITEREAQLQIEHFRSQQDLFIEPSFKTIPAYGANGAMMHYSTTENDSPVIQAEGLFLLDSGGQYYDGTTDITRTIAAGPLTDEAIRDFTLVLKAHIRLNLLTFLEGATGSNIDVIARQCLWENHMDYKSGTGHSIGYLLGVHEGPGRIRKEFSDVVLKPGMVLSNEPGVYKEGNYGIRIENTLHINEVARNDTGTYLNFQVISYCPIDLRCIDVKRLEPKELKWLNDYHQLVNTLLSPHLDQASKEWLDQATRGLHHDG